MARNIELAKRIVGDGSPPYVIPEIGINHEGDYKKAKRMVLDAHSMGAECVKFQCHIVEDEMIPNNVIPGNARESIWDIMKRCALTEDEEIDLKKLTEELGMLYLSTPFSRAAADRLEEMNVEAYKIGSGECNNYPLIEHIANFGKPIILSTGMNDLESVGKAVAILERKQVDYALMHCTSMYPTPYSFVRLGAIVQMRDRFPNAVVGLSDHSIGNYTCFAAVPLGARVLEKHFTSDLSWPGPDIPISINPLQLKDLIVGSKAIFEALGGHKEVLEQESRTIEFAYASVVAIQDIGKGDLLSRDNLWVKRPGTGQILAEKYSSLIGKRAVKAIKKNEQIRWDMIE